MAARRSGPRKDPKTGTYSFIVDVGADPRTGKRRQARRRGFRTEREANEAYRKIIRGLEDNTYRAPKDTKITFTAYVRAEALPHLRGQVQPSTLESYERNLETHVLPRLGAMLVRDIAPSHLDRLYLELASDGARRDSKKGALSLRTIKYVHAIVRRVLAEAVRTGYIIRNPADAARPPKVDEQRQHEMRTWTGEQLARFLDAVKDDSYFPAWVFLAMTGCRRGEALGLRWCDVDLDAGRVSIRQTVTAVRHRVHIATRTKTGAGRPIDLDATTVATLRAHKLHQAEEMLSLGLRPEGETLVFCFPDGRPFHPERFSREFERRLERFELEPRIRLHDLRHTWATLALEAGVPLKVVSERLGHAKTGITSDLYQHVTETMQSEAAEKVAALIFKTPSA